MSLPVAYWDSSALIPLCVSQPQSAMAGLLFEKFAVVSWWVTQVEMVSGLTRLIRMGQISTDQFRGGMQLMREITRGWNAVFPPPEIAVHACSLLERYPLRAADALQLAVAFQACEQIPKDYIFITADLRLAGAARQSGFSVEFI